MMIKIISFLCLLIGSISNTKAADLDDPQLYNAPIGGKSFIKGMVVVSLVNANALRAKDMKIDDDIHSAIIFEGSNPLILGVLPETSITVSGFREKLRDFVNSVPFLPNENNVWALGISFAPNVGNYTSGEHHPSRLAFWNTEQCLERTTNGVKNKDNDTITYKSIKSWMVLEEDAIKTLNFFLIWHNRNALVYQYVGNEGVMQSLVTGSTGTEDKLYLNCSLFVSCVLKTLRIMHTAERLASAISRQKGSALHLCYRQHHRLAVARKTVEKEDLYELTEHAFYLKAILGNPAIHFMMSIQPSALSQTVNWLSTDGLDQYSYEPFNKNEWAKCLKKFREIGGVDDTTEESPSFIDEAIEDTKKGGWCSIM